MLNFGVKVADARDPDYGAVASLLARACREWEACLGAQAMEVCLTDVGNVLARAAVAQILIAQCDGHTLGTAALYLNAREGGIHWPRGFAAIHALGVEPPWRRLGIGRCLVETCVDRAREAGAMFLGVRAGPCPPTVRGFFEHLGFEPLHVEAPLVDQAPSPRDLDPVAYLFDLR
jgi:GNAT superfamily N-acetyltransferase